MAGSAALTRLPAVLVIYICNTVKRLNSYVALPTHPAHRRDEYGGFKLTDRVEPAAPGSAQVARQ